MNLTKRWIAVATVVAIALVAGCSGGEEAEGKKPSKGPTTTSLSDCVVKDTLPENAPEGAEQSTTTSIVQKCLDDAFTATVGDKGSQALKDLSADQVLGFGHGLCAYAAALGADPSRAPSYKELIASTAGSWKVEPEVVEEMLGFAGTLCPNQLEPILTLKNQVGSVEITLEAAGSGSMTVSYAGPDGGPVQDTVSSPWTSSIRFDDPTDVRFSVTAEGGPVTCTIRANDKQVTTATVTDGLTAECAASASDIRDAAG